jgi:hypothetical protein
MGAQTTGAASGAASGAAAGAAVGGPWGAVIGGVLGGLGGLFGGKSADKAAKQNRRAIRMAYREKLRQSAIQRRQLLGRQAVGYAAAGVDVARGTPGLLMDTTNKEFSIQQGLIAANEGYALKGAASPTDWWSVGMDVAKMGASIYTSLPPSAGAGKTSQSSPNTSFGGASGLSDGSAYAGYT